MLNDAEVAAVLTHITNQWGNKAEPFTAEEVKIARSTSAFPTLADLEKASAYLTLPKAPTG